MKTNQVFITLLLSSAVALPGFAQQSNGTSSAQPANAPAQSVSASNLEPLPDTKPRDFWDGDDPNLVNLVTHPMPARNMYNGRWGRFGIGSTNWMS